MFLYFCDAQSFNFTVAMDTTPQVERDLPCLNTTSYTSPGACDVTQSTTPSTETSLPSPTTSPPVSVDPPISLPVIIGAAAGVFLITATSTFIVIVCLCARRRVCVFGKPIKRHRASFHDNPTYTSPGKVLSLTATYH